MKVTSPQHTFGGANIKGTPAMSASSVRHDLKVLKKVVGVAALVEFRWRWYWVVLSQVLRVGGWGTYPSRATALRLPNYGGQALVWRKRLFRCTAKFVRPAFDFAKDNSKIMENRWFRAVLLLERKSNLSCWYVVGHFVVHGDDKAEGPRRQNFMEDNLLRFFRVIDECLATGDPVVAYIDGNIHVDTWAYRALTEAVNNRHGRIRGVPGVEYVLTFDNLHAKVIVDKVSEISVTKLKTDHEYRLVDHHLEGKQP